MGDVNGDGFPDKVVIDSFFPNKLFLSDEFGATIEQVDSAITIGTPGYSTSLTSSKAYAMGDLNGDGYDDVIVVNDGRYDKNQGD